MNASLIISLLVAAAILNWLAEVKLRKKLLTELLDFQRTGNEQKYFQLLKSAVALICLTKKGRNLLGLDYYLAYSDYQNINKYVNYFIRKSENLDQDHNLLIRLMRSFIFYLEEKHNKDAVKLENYLTTNCRLIEVREEIVELHRVYLEPDQALLTKLTAELAHAQEPQRQLIIYQRLIKATDRLGLKEQEKDYLAKMRALAQKTIKMEEF